MAKKRKEETEEEELDFKLPKFDEEAYLKKERRNIKVFLTSFLFGMLIAVICFGFFTVLTNDVPRWELILLVGVVNSVWLRYIFQRLNIDLKELHRMQWVSSYLAYFFTWLLVLIVLVNPPFYDAEPPHVEAVVLPGAQEPGGTIMIVANIIDNVGVKKEGISFSINDPNGMNTTPEFTFDNSLFKYTYENPDALLGTYTFTLIASDEKGLKTRIDGSFVYSNATLEIISSRFTDIRSGDPITIKANEMISAHNFRVYYRIDNGSDINMDRKDLASKDRYETSAEFEGWRPNENVTVQIYAEATHYFINIPEKFSNTVKDTTTYKFSTGDDQVNIGTEDPLVEYNYTLAVTGKDQLPNTLNYILPYPISISATPGFEIVLVVIAVGIALVLFKHKKKDNTP